MKYISGIHYLFARLSLSFSLMVGDTVVGHQRGLPGALTMYDALVTLCAGVREFAGGIYRQ